jgi:glycosyltransferase involved in cell wall biosynthesis
MKILYITTISNTVNAFLIPHIEMLINEGHTVDLAFNIKQDIDSRIPKMGCKVHDIPFSRSILKTSNFKSIKLLKNMIIEENYNIIHTHTPIASAITRLACKNLSNVKVYYTAHGFHFYKGAPLINWMTYFLIEKWLSKFTDVLITINSEDYSIAKNKFHAKKTVYIPGMGIINERYNNLDVNRKRLLQNIGIPDESFILLSIGELNKNKNHEIIIKALAKMKTKSMHYLICGEGPKKEHLNKLSRKLHLESNVHLLGFRKDIPEICNISNIFLFPSKREGLGLAAIEAMASGLPIITSNVHGINDYSKNGVTGFKCAASDTKCFYKSIDYLYTNNESRKIMGDNNRIEAVKYELSFILKKMSEVYKEVLNNDKS